MASAAPHLTIRSGPADNPAEARDAVEALAIAIGQAMARADHEAEKRADEARSDLRPL